MLRDHRLVAKLLAAIAEFRAGHIELGHLQRQFSAAMSALEGDVPRAVHEAVRRTEADLESAAFNDVDVENVLRRFTEVVAGAELSSAADASSEEG